MSIYNISLYFSQQMCYTVSHKEGKEATFGKRSDEGALGMSRTHLDKELHELNNQIVQLGSLVDDALAKALEALKTGDLAKCGLVIEADVTIDGLRAAVEEHTIRLLTLQQPLGGRDLRFLTSALSIAGDLERIGDGAAGIAQIMLRMEPLRGAQLSHVQVHVDADTSVATKERNVTEADIVHDML